MRGRIRHGVAVLTAAVSLCALVPASASGQDAEAAQAEQDLDAARRRLADVDARIDAVRHAVEQADARLGRAGAELADVEVRLAAAEEQLRRAAVAERAAAAELSDATLELDREVVGYQAVEEQLDDLVARTWMHGNTVTGDLLLRGVSRAQGPHEVLVALRTVRGVIERDQRLVTSTQTAARDVADARADVGRARRLALAEQRSALRGVRELERLRRAKAGLVERIETELADRRAALAALAGDRAAAAVLVERLRIVLERVRGLLAQALIDPATIPVDGPPPAWTGALPSSGQPWAAVIDSVAARVGLDGRLLAAVVWTESGFYPAAVSSAGAIGLAQLMPGTAAGLGVDPWDPVANLTGGASYLRSMIDRFGSVELGLAAYNAGPGRVEAAGRAIPAIAETQLYVLRVIERYERLVAG